MKIIEWVAGLGAIVMLAGILHGLAAGDIWTEGRALLGMPWGRVTIADLYVGFALFAAWVVAREPSRVRAGAWIAAVLTLGNLAACVYLFLAVRASGGDFKRLALGARLG